LVVSGGAGIQGNVNVGGNTIISGEVGVSGDANVDGGMNVAGNADICGYAYPGTSLVQQVHIRATTASSSSTSGRWWCLAEREYKRECWRYAGVVGDMDVSGSAVVYGGMNVVGNADICGNVLLTSGSSAVQQVHINDGVNRHNSGRWWWRVGGDKREGEHKRQYGRVELFVGGVVSNSYRFRQRRFTRRLPRRRILHQIH
jgi:hypothetical protein